MKYNNDYKVPKNLVKKLITEYSEEIVTDPDTDELLYEDTLEGIAAKIMEDYDKDKMKRTFGYEIFSIEEMVKWLKYNVPDMYETLLVINKEL